MYIYTFIRGKVVWNTTTTTGRTRRIVRDSLNNRQPVTPSAPRAVCLCVCVCVPCLCVCDRITAFPVAVLLHARNLRGAIAL